MSFLDNIEGFFQDPKGTIAGEFDNLGEELRRWRDNVANLDPTGVSEELWGEAGRFAYAAGAEIMAKRSPTGVPVQANYKDALRPYFGDLVDRVTLHWGTDPLDKWAADKFSISMTDVHTAAQTFGFEIYIRHRQGAEPVADELKLLAHELVHAAQFVRLGESYSGFGYHYFKNYKKANQKYANNKMEQEASKRASEVMKGLRGTANESTFTVEGWFGAENQGGGLAAADLNGSGRPDLLVFHIDNPGGGNTGYYRVGWDLNAKGAVTGGWSKPTPIPGWFGDENQGGGLAVADLNGSGRPDLIVFHIDNPGGGNTGYYRVGWDLDAKGKVKGGWTDHIPVPGWFGAENQGGGLAVADLNSSGRPDLLVFHIDNPGGGNTGYYRVGWDLNAKGKAKKWTEPIAVPGWFGDENQGGGLAVADLNGGGRPDLIVFHIDNPGGGNNGYYRIGRDLDAKGRVRGKWTDPKPTKSWYGYECQGGGITVVDLDGKGSAYLAAFHIDNPKAGNVGLVTYVKLR